MDKEKLIDRINSLCDAKGVNLTTAFKESGVGKNFRNNLKSSDPRKKNLSLLAQYFGVTVEYLIGEESSEMMTRRIMGLVVEWLMDNDYDYTEEENQVTIGSDGEYIHLAPSDFANQCLAIKKLSEDGFELAMQDWCRKHFTVNDSRKIINKSRNIINDSPNATLLVDNTDLSKQERELIKMYREFSLEDQLKAIGYMLELKKGEK